MYARLDACEPLLPRDRPRYLMASVSGRLIEGVRRGDRPFDYAWCRRAWGARTALHTGMALHGEA